MGTAEGGFAAGKPRASQKSTNELAADLDGLLRRGDLFAAFDLGRRAIETGGHDRRVRYLTVLALARSGAAAEALIEYDHLRLGEEDDVDCASLRARLLKDIAFASAVADPAAIAAAADAYEAVYRKTGHYFPGINAATLKLIAGDAVLGQALAAELLKSPEIVNASDYYAVATRGEALTILSRWDEAAEAFAAARGRLDHDFGALSSTFTQIRRLLSARYVPPEAREALLGALKPPVTVHFHGGRHDVDADAEAGLARKIAAALAEEEVRFAFGVLASKGDIVLAETLLAAGVTLSIVQPYLADDNDTALEPADLVARRKQIIARAASVAPATEEADLGDGSQLDYADMIAMGLARMRSDHLHGDCFQLGLVSESNGSDARAAAAWGATGGRVKAIAVPPAKSPALHNTPVQSGEGREIRALLFADFRKFARLTERQFPEFWNYLLADVARLLSEHRPAVLYRNTWGDAFFLVLADAATAAQLAISIQERLKHIQDGREHKLDLRIGLHHGPVYRGWDPVCEERTFYGAQVVKAARAEPMAPAGEVVVTEPLAAMLALTARDRFSCSYVGQVKFPKDYGEYRMYRLSRRSREAG
jgi:class 3 adenylate cyclase